MKRYLKNMYILRISKKFDAAHYLKNYQGKCANLHGHTWKVVFWFKFNELNDVGIAKDFKEIKEVLDKILPDHQCLNHIYSFNPTAENLARHFFEEVKKNLPVVQVDVYESEDCCVSYIED